MTAPLPQNDLPNQPSSLAKTNPILLMTVIGLGIAIVVVLALMVGMVVKRMNARQNEPKAQPATHSSIPQPGTPASYNTMIVREGTSIADAKIEGGLLVLRTTNDDADEVMTFDPKTGQLLARITLKKSDQQ